LYDFWPKENTDLQIFMCIAHWVKMRMLIWTKVTKP